MKNGIVMEGGAMRGLFTAGLLDVLMENKITFDGAVGVSAGATFGCNLKSGQIGRTLRYNTRFCRDKRYAGLESLLRTGDIFNAKFDYDDIPNRLDPFDKEAFEANPMEFWVTAADVDTGQAVYHKCRDGGAEDVEWLRASASIPGFSNVVYCKGKCLVSPGPFTQIEAGTDRYEEADAEGMGLSDGGTADSVPVKFMEDLGYDRILVVCTREAGFRKKMYRGLPFLKYRLRYYPALYRAIACRHLMYNAEMDYLDRCAEEKPDRIMVIRPPQPLGIPQICRDPDEMRRVYDLGRAEAIRRMEDIRVFLGCRHSAAIPETIV